MNRSPSVTASAVPSPCINVCRMQPSTGLCEGCQRTLEEIAAWSQLDEPGRRAVMARVEQRRAALGPSDRSDRNPP